MVRKYNICPPSLPGAVVTRCVRIPASQDWLAVFNNALLSLTEPATWEQLNPGDLTPEECAAAAYNVYQDYLTGDCSVDCEDVLSCLPTYTSDQLAAGTYNVNLVDASDTTVINTRFPPATRATEILPPPASCDLDELWAGVREIVQRIDDNGRDWWETVVAQTDTINRIAEIIALVPLFGDIVGEGLQLLANIAPDMRDLYVAYSSTEQNDAIACDLFQLVCGECRYPTYEELFDYYAGRSALGEAAWQNIAFGALIDVLLGTSSSSAAIVYMTTNIVQLWVLGAAATWLQTHGVGFVALWAGVGASDPSDAWEILCGSCGETWSHEWLNGDGPGDWTILPAHFGNECSGTYNATLDRFEGCFAGVNSARVIEVAWDFLTSATLTRIEVDYAYKITRDNPSDFMTIYVPADQQRAQRAYFGTIIGSDTLTWSGNIVVDGVLLTNICGCASEGDGAYAYITRIRVDGVGADPFV